MSHAFRPSPSQLRTSLYSSAQDEVSSLPCQSFHALSAAFLSSHSSSHHMELPKAYPSFRGSYKKEPRKSSDTARALQAFIIDVRLSFE